MISQEPAHTVAGIQETHVDWNLKQWCIKNTKRHGFHSMSEDSYRLAKLSKIQSWGEMEKTAFHKDKHKESYRPFNRYKENW